LPAQVASSRRRPSSGTTGTGCSKELLRAVYAAVGMPAARAALERLDRWADGVDVAELSRLACTIKAWQAEILAWHATKGCSNGPTDAVNLLIKKVKRVGHGFRNWRTASQALDELMGKLLAIRRLLEAEEDLAKREPRGEPDVTPDGP
jgi:hypothetical protein